MISKKNSQSREKINTQKMELQNISSEMLSKVSLVSTPTPVFKHQRNISSGRRKQLPFVFFNGCFDKGQLKNLVAWYVSEYGEKLTIDFLEILKKAGFHHATQAGISLGLDDLQIPPKKNTLISKATLKIHNLEKLTGSGNITVIEKAQGTIDIWNSTSESLRQSAISHFRNTNPVNPIYMMAFSGARGNISQVRQLVGMRGLMADPQGAIIEFPIQSNFREGITLTEYLISCYGARKGLVDTALRTATTGYLTRRLVDTVQHVVVTLFDCQTKEAITISKKPLAKRLIGRVLAKSYTKDGKKIALKNQIISPKLADLLGNEFPEIQIRSPLTCEANKPLCQLCYGWNLAHGKIAQLGDAVGVIAAQAIGEPGTQLTMRTFHTGGVGVFSEKTLKAIMAPFFGKIEFPAQLPGQFVRTTHGKIVYMVKYKAVSSNRVLLSILPKDPRDNIFYLTEQDLPVGSILFVKQGQLVQAGQLIAQSSQIRTADEKMPESVFPVRSPMDGELFIEYSRSFVKIKVSKEESLTGYRLIKANKITDSKPFQDFYPPKFTQNTQEGVFFPWTLCQLGRFWIFSSKVTLTQFTSGKSVIKKGDLISPATPIFQNVFQSNSPKQIQKRTKFSGQLVVGLRFKEINLLKINFQRSAYCYSSSRINKIFTCSNLNALIWFSKFERTQKSGYQYFLPFYSNLFETSLSNFPTSLFPKTSQDFQTLLLKVEKLEEIFTDREFFGRIQNRVKRLSEPLILQAIPRGSEFDLFLKILRTISRKETNFKVKLLKIFSDIEIQKIIQNNRVNWFFDIDKSFFTKFEQKIQNFLIIESPLESDTGVKALLNFLKEESDLDFAVGTKENRISLTNQVNHDNSLEFRYQLGDFSIFDRQQALRKLFSEWSFFQRVNELTTDSLPLKGINRFIEIVSLPEEFHQIKQKDKFDYKKFPKGIVFRVNQICFKTQIKKNKIQKKSTPPKNTQIIFGNISISKAQTLQILFWQPRQIKKTLTLPGASSKLNFTFLKDSKNKFYGGISNSFNPITEVRCISPAVEFVFQKISSDFLNADILQSLENFWFYIPLQIKNTLQKQSKQSGIYNSQVRHLEKTTSVKETFQNEVFEKFSKPKVKRSFLASSFAGCGKLVFDEICFSKPIRINIVPSSKISLLNSFSQKSDKLNWYNRLEMLNPKNFTKFPLINEILNPKFLLGYSFEITSALYYRFSSSQDAKKPNTHYSPVNILKKRYQPSFLLCFILLKPSSVPIREKIIHDWSLLSNSSSKISVSASIGNKQYSRPKLETSSPYYNFDFLNSFQSEYSKEKNLFPIHLEGLLPKELYQVQKFVSSFQNYRQKTIPTRNLILFSSALFPSTNFFDIFQKNWILENTQVQKSAYRFDILGEILRFDIHFKNSQISILRDTDLLTINLPSKSRIDSSLLGRQIRSGTKITKDFASPWSGQIIKITPESITLRRGMPFLASIRGLVAISPGQLVQKDDLLVMLKSRRLQTEDIVQGIPKIEQLFEARSTQDGQPLRLTLKRRLARSFWKLLMSNSVDVAVSKSIRNLQDFLVENIVEAYGNQGVQISDKHVEIVVREMTDHVRINKVPGFIPGELISWGLFKKFQKKIFPGPYSDIIFSDFDRWQYRPAYQPVILGITKTVLQSSSFLLAASFQEVNRVLIGSSLTARKDFLRGLHENIITGLAIPAGTGLLENPRYSKIFASRKFNFSAENSKLEFNLQKPNLLSEKSESPEISDS